MVEIMKKKTKAIKISGRKICGNQNHANGREEGEL